MTIVRPSSVWFELLRLLPNVTKYNRRGQEVEFWTVDDFKAALDDQMALGFDWLIIPYTQYFARNFGRNMPVYYDYDVGRLNTDWDASFPASAQFDPIAVALAHWSGAGGVILGDNRCGLSLMTLDMYTTLQNFEPKSQLSWSGGATVGSTGTATFDAESVLEVWADAGFQLRGRNGGLIQITGWNSLTSVTGTVLEALPATTFAAYDWALTQADPRRYDNMSITELMLEHGKRSQATVAALVAEYDDAKFTGIYTSPEMSGCRTFLNGFYRPIISTSLDGNPGHTSYGKTLWLGPGFCPDMNPFDSIPNPNVVAAMQAVQDDLPEAVNLNMMFQSALGPRLSIETFEGAGVNVSYGLYAFDQEPRVLIEQRKSLYARYRSHFDALTQGETGRLVFGTVEETWTMPGPLYQDEFPGDVRDVIECLEVVSAAGVELVSIYAGPAFIERGPEEKSLVLSQRNYLRIDYRTRAEALWEHLKRLMDFLGGRSIVNSTEVILFVRLPEDQGVLRIWTGVGRLDLIGNAIDTEGGIYLGTGATIDMPDVGMLLNDQAERVGFTMSGVDRTIIAAIEDENVTFDGAEVYQAFICFGDNGQPISPPIWYGRHVIDRMTGSVLTAQGNASAISATLSFEAASEFVDRRQRRMEVWSDSAQRLKSPGDTGLKRVALYNTGTTVKWPS